MKQEPLDMVEADLEDSVVGKKGKGLSTLFKMASITQQCFQVFLTLPEQTRVIVFWKDNGGWHIFL